jgi:YbgC/YbaW family acyl-CoA thioester hydrolase
VTATPLSPPFRVKRRVQFYETDAAGIVHFSWYFRYMEEAEHALWRAAGLSVHAPGSEFGWPRVAAACDFHRSLQFEDEFEVEITIAALTTRTIRFACRLLKGETAVATGALTVACVKRQPDAALKAVPIPPEILSRLQALPA